MAGHDRLTPEGRRFFKEIEELKKLQLRVGYQHGAKSKKRNGAAADEGPGAAAGEGSGAKNGKKEPADIADIATWNEVGAGSIPKRPFMRQSVERNTDKISAMCKAQLHRIARGEADAQDILQKLGAMQKGFIENQIEVGEFVENAKSTIARKKSEKPLIDTGRMRQSVNFTIVPKGG